MLTNNTFRTFTGFEYLCIDVANYKGMDKEDFDTRIQWVMDNFQNLEDIQMESIDDPELYTKAVMSIRRACRGEEIGHVTYWDGCCSGIQIMSALTGCVQGAYNTGMIDPNKRMDAYSNCTREMNIILARQGLSSVRLTRKQIKQALMTAGYGSKAIPRKTFGEDNVEYFYEAAAVIAPGAMGLMDELLDSWQPFALSHDWVMPDNFHVHVKVMDKKETRIEIDELDHATFILKYADNVGSERGLSNVANVTHSCDAYLLRTLKRRCNYDHANVVRALELLKARQGTTTVKPVNELALHINLWEQSKMADTVILDKLSSENVFELPMDLTDKLVSIIEVMLTYKPFPVLTVHDAFGAHPNNCNEVRYWYKSILAEFADSTLLQHILNQLHNYPEGKYTKLSNNLGDKIRGSNYALS